MKAAISLLLLLFLVLWSSCSTDIDRVESTGNLDFSRDTIFLDTIFTNHSSATYTLKVYNRSNEDIYIPEIALSRGEGSAYRLNVDGLPGKRFEDVEILAKDSIFIFIETTVDLQGLDQKEFLYEDAIKFKSSDHQQEIPLITLVKDAVFLYPEENEDGTMASIPIGKDASGNDILVRGFYMEAENLVLSAAKAYVIYGYAVVPPGKTLLIQPGARIYFHSDSGMIISENASMNAEGGWSTDQVALENEIILQGSRLEEEYQDIPGQWGTIWFQEGSTNNVISYTTIRNASIGIFAEGNTAEDSSFLLIRNSQIYNSSINGLRGVAASISAENLVVNLSGQSSVHLVGGNYDFRHSTLVNFWGEGYRRFPAVYLENHLSTGENTGLLSLSARFSNCIIYGNEERELLLNANKDAPFNILFENCLLRFEDASGSFQGQALYDFTNEDLYQEMILNENPFFWNVDENDFRLQENSPAIDAGNLPTAYEVPTDMLQNSRIPQPDLGAYEKITPEKARN